jgi:hypothetical protein
MRKRKPISEEFIKNYLYKEESVLKTDATLAWIGIYGLIASKGTASRTAKRMLLS